MLSVKLRQDRWPAQLALRLGRKQPTDSPYTSNDMTELTTPVPLISQRRLPAVAAKWLSLAAFALLVYYALFQLPFFFPPRQRLMSASYTYGFNNSVAIVATVLLLGVVTLWYVLRRGKAIQLPIVFAREGATVAGPLLRTTFTVAVVCYAAFTFVMYLYDVNAFPWLMWETRHLLHRTWLMDLYGMRPYTELSAEYGPILTYAPSWMFWLLRPLGATHEQAYFTAHFLLNVAGLWCVYYVLSRAVMPDRAGAIAFALLAIAGFGLWMGVNGVLIRYLSPFATLLLGHRILKRIFSHRGFVAGWASAVISVLLFLVVNILLSPEVGVAFALAWFGYTVLMLRSDKRVFAVSLIGFAATILLCWLLLPAAYYGTLLRFSEGANNLPLLPAAHLLFYIPTLFILVPPLLAASVRERPSGDVRGAAICGALGILCVVMAPGALGRCDPPHVLFYGMGPSMLLMVRLANMSWRKFVTYSLAYTAVFILFIEAVNLVVFYGIGPKTLFSSHPVRNVVQRLKSAVASERPKTSTLSALDHYPHLGLPFASFGDPAVERYVITNGKLIPEYYVAIVGVYNAAALKRKLRDVGAMEYLLVPRSLATRGVRNPCAGYLKSMQQWFLYPAHFPCRADPLDPTMTLRAFIADNYRSVEEVGSWVVFRRIGEGSTVVPIDSYVSAR